MTVSMHCLFTSYSLHCLFNASYNTQISSTSVQNRFGLHASYNTQISSTSKTVLAYSLPIHCLFTAYSLLIHCLFTAYSLPIHCLFTAYSPSNRKLLSRITTFALSNRDETRESADLLCYVLRLR
jgi:hypothetical protein